MEIHKIPTNPGCANCVGAQNPIWPTFRRFRNQTIANVIYDRVIYDLGGGQKCILIFFLAHPAFRP